MVGNIATDFGIASLEYAVDYLKTPMIYVLRHTSCGAVDAAIKMVKDGAEFPGELPKLVASRLCRGYVRVEPREALGKRDVGKRVFDCHQPDGLELNYSITHEIGRTPGGGRHLPTSERQSISCALSG